ncbi:MULTISPECIES: hypothetical protein [unclassified Nocardiopsis]|uniref:hypothetical protein n=1 Tax=unclassified Nocardiopsis TaxID=2649073 RepID=UPI00135AC225|nr:MULTISPECIES: hypothetical protein [unclassified Nocardiopsis]
MHFKHRRFVLARESGVVAEGIRWGDGAVAVRWLSEHPSTVVWADLESAMAVHGHDGATRVEWCDEPALKWQVPEHLRHAAGERGMWTT